MERYIVKADGKIVGKFMSEKQANKFCWEYLSECWEQDIPFAPNMKIEVEVLEGEVQRKCQNF